MVGEADPLEAGAVDDEEDGAADADELELLELDDEPQPAAVVTSANARRK